MSDAALRRLLPLVKRVARHLIQSRRLPASIDADDLVQVGLIAVDAALPRYDAARGASLETFCARRALGGMLDELRRTGPLGRNAWRARRAHPEEAWPENFDPPDPAPGPLAVLIERERVARVESAIGCLPPRSRDVLRLLLDGGLTQREIGVLFGLSESRVGQVAAAAVETLAALIADTPPPLAAPPAPPAGRVRAGAGALYG